MKSTVLSGMFTGALKARWKPRRATAASQQSSRSCNQAPRPGASASGSGTTSPFTVAKRRSSSRGARSPHPAQRRRGLCLPDDVGVLALERLVALESAVAGAGQRGVRAAAPVAEDGGAAAADLLLLVAAVGLFLGELGLGADVDAPAGQPGGEPGVLALAADRQRQLVVGHDHRGLLVLVVDEDLADAGGAERLGDEPGRLVVVGDDVDLLAAQLGDDHAHAGAARADARADRVDALLVRDDRDLRAVAGLARDVLDLDEAVGDLRDLELEQRLDEVRVAAGHDDARALRRLGDL